MFDESLFKDFIAHNVPMLKALLLLVSERPQLQQYIGFLGWRSWAASSATLIPWANLRNFKPKRALRDYGLRLR